MHQYDRIYNILLDTQELDAAGTLKKAIAGLTLAGVAAFGGKHIHKVTRGMGPKTPTPVSVQNVNHPDYKPKNPGEAAAIKQHKKDAASFKSRSTGARSSIGNR